MLSLSVDGGDLRDAAVWAARLCPTRHAVPILQGVMLDADEELTLSAYDLDTAGSVSIPATILTAGRALVSGNLLAAIAKTLDAKADVRIGVNGSEVTVSVGRNKWSLPTLLIEDYPTLPQHDGEVGKLDSADLRRALTRCLPAADRSNVEPLHGCIKFETAGQELTIIALDRHRMAVATVPWDGPEADIPVPTTFAEAMTRALAPESSAASLSTDGLTQTLTAASRSLTGRLGAGEWVAWRPILAKARQDSSAIFVVAEVQAAVERVLAVADEKVRTVRLDIDTNGFQIESISDKSAANAEASVSEYVGKPKTTAVNPWFLRDALATLESDLAVLRVGEQVARPLDFAPLDGDGNAVADYRHLVMPVSYSKLPKRKVWGAAD